MIKPTREDFRNKQEFTFEDSTLKMLEFCEETGRYLYGRYWLKECRKEWVGTLNGYEVIIPVKYINPDGSVVMTYPSNSSWGKNGWSLPANSTRDEIDYYLKGYNLVWDKQEYFKMKRTMDEKSFALHYQNKVAKKGNKK